MYYILYKMYTGKQLPPHRTPFHPLFPSIRENVLRCVAIAARQRRRRRCHVKVSYIYAKAYILPAALCCHIIFSCRCCSLRLYTYTLRCHSVFAVWRLIPYIYIIQNVQCDVLLCFTSYTIYDIVRQELRCRW